MQLTEKYNLLKAAEEKAAKLRRELIQEMKLKASKAPRGYTTIIAERVPKYNKIDGRAHLNKVIKGRALDPDVLAVLDELVKS